MYKVVVKLVHRTTATTTISQVYGPMTWDEAVCKERQLKDTLSDVDAYHHYCVSIYAE